jgi:hypothetical protein
MAKGILASRSVRERLGRWYSEQLMEETPISRGSAIGWLFGKFKQQAVTINKRVYLAPDAPDLEYMSGIALLAHEYYHVRQQQEMGWWNFLARYLWHWRPSHIKDGRSHPLEAPAYTRAEEILSKLEGRT